MKTLNNLFILDAMKDCTILAGHRGLTRNVQFVNISDTPDVVQFLGENHLLLTTGYAFKDDPQLMCDLIQEMHALNCTGMVIKINRFLKALPEEVKLLADELAFPIIDLPTDLTLGDLSRHLLNYLNDHEAEQLYYALHVQKEFSDMMIKEYSLNSLVEQLGHFLDRPTMLLNHRGEKISQSHGFRKDSMQVVEQEIINYIKGDLDRARKGTTFTVPSRENSITTFPVQTKRQHDSMLVIIDSSTLPYPSSQMAIEQAGNVISFTIIKEQAIEENSRLLKNNFFADLIEMRIHSNEEILSRTHYYGLEDNLDTICIICTVDPDGEHYEALQLYEKRIGELHNTIYDQLEDEIVNGNMEATLFTKEKYFVMVLQFTHYNEEEITNVTNFVKSAQNNLQTDDVRVSFGISNAIQSPIDIPNAYYEAVDAIMNGYDLNLTGFINFYRTREIEELLTTLPRKDLKALYENTLKSLAYPQTKEDIDLVKTLETYLDCQCEISETSRRLYIHRNTVKYRIEKMEELLNCSFRDPTDSLRIRVALLIGTILESEQ